MVRPRGGDPASMLLFALAALLAVSDDWPQLLGPHRNGVYTGETVGWPSQFAWQKDVGSGFAAPVIVGGKVILFHRKRSEEHTSELQSHSFISYAVFCLKKKK